MRKQDFMRVIEIHKELGYLENKFFEILNKCEANIALAVLEILNECEASIALAVLDTVIDDLIDLKSIIKK